jgi:CpXC protein
MSIFKPMTVTCPACEHSFDIDVVESVNADRRPDLRVDILDASFQVMTCPGCQEEFRLDPIFNYIDVGRGQWISVQPRADLLDWIDLEAEATDVFATAYGERAPGAAKVIGQDLTPRLVFGWPALREKLIARELGLDDVTLELTKLALIDSMGGQPMGQGAELRLLGKEEDELDFAWVVAEEDRTIEQLLVPMEIYQDIADAPDDWTVITDQLITGPFVDLQKLYFGDASEAQAV